MKREIEALYAEFVESMIDVLQDFPNCCYQISGAVAYLVRELPLTGLQCVWGTYMEWGVRMPHGWVTAKALDGTPLIIDFAHLQFEAQYLSPACPSYYQLLKQQLESGEHVTGDVVFDSGDPEYCKYVEM